MIYMFGCLWLPIVIDKYGPFEATFNFKPENIDNAMRERLVSICILNQMDVIEGCIVYVTINR